MTKLHRILLAAACLFALPALAQAAPLSIDHPWSRATTMAGGNGVVFLTIVNSGSDADALVAVASPTAHMASLHRTLMKDKVMEMRSVKEIAVPAKGSVTLKPGADHIMLMGLKAPLKQGQTLPLTLTFRKAGKVEVQVPVLSAGSDGSH